MAGQGIDVTEHLWIALSDGTRLAARLWLPQGAEARPVPAILEYIPYRKRDGTRGRDEPMHGFFAAQGYAAIRVDMRGSGESDGLLDDEYLLQEQEDALQVIAWIAAQPWCSGAVGMMGKSWGGFNCLQVAARRPPALKAIITVCSTVDRFADDIHYMGGCLLNDNLWWGSIMLAYQGRPPDPALVGEGWRDIWRARLEHMPLWPALWLAHQSRDAYWRHGSICEDWEAIACPVLAIGGWADAYTNAVPQLLAGLKVPRQGIIGPWAHLYPQDGAPAPAIDFLGEATRWWDHWLKGQPNGIMDEPMLRAFIEDYRAPATSITTAPGRFVAEPLWPSPTIADHILHFAPGRLSAEAGENLSLALRSPVFTGTAGGEWMGTGVPGEMPADQRFDDAYSLVFDSEVLDTAVEILGFPQLELTLASDRPQAQIVARLCDVEPDGTSLRVSYGVLNLSHRDGSAAPKPMLEHAVTALKLSLKVCGHRFPAGHRIRLAISSAYWPLLWPSPEAATLTIATGPSRLHLPVRTEGFAGKDFAAPRRAAPAPATRIEASALARHVEFDLLARTARYSTIGRGGLFGEGVMRWDEIGTMLRHDLSRRLDIAAEDPLSAKSEIEQVYEMGRAGWTIRIETIATMMGDATHFRLVASLRAFENGALVHSRSWDERIARQNL